MNKLYNILLLLMLAASMQSCKKSSSDTVKPEMPTDDPSKISLVSKINFQYSPNDRRVEEYIYDDKRRVSQSRTENYSAVPSGNWEIFNYKYDANDRLVKAVQLNRANEVQTTRLFTYNFNTTAGEQVYEVVQNGVRAFAYPISLDANGRVIFVAKRYGVAYDAQGNFTYYGAPEWMKDWDSTIQWDDKKNPFHNAVGLNPNFNYLVELYPLQTPHNLLTINNSGKMVMVYNKEGFPTSSTFTATNGSQTLVTYEYIKI